MIKNWRWAILWIIGVVGLLGCSSNDSIMPPAQIIGSPSRILAKAGNTVQTTLQISDPDNWVKDDELVLSAIQYTKGVSVRFGQQTIGQQKSVQVFFTIENNALPRAYYLVGIVARSARSEARGVINITIEP